MHIHRYTCIRKILYYMILAEDNINKQYNMILTNTTCINKQCNKDEYLNDNETQTNRQTGIITK